MKNKLVITSLLIGLISNNLLANNFDLALDIARYDNIEKTVKNENAIVNYIKQYIVDTGDVLNISRLNIANIYNLESNSEIFKNYNNELIEISYNPNTKKIEIFNMLPVDDKYKKMYINSINRNNELTFDDKIIFSLDKNLKNVLNLELEILSKNVQNLISISKVEPTDKTKAWFRPDSEGSFNYYYFSVIKNQWINLGKIGKGEVLTFNQEDVNFSDLILFDGQEISMIDSNLNIDNKYLSGNTWVDLNNKEIEVAPTTTDTNIADISGSLSTSDNVLYNVNVGYITNFLNLGVSEFDKYDVGSTITGTIINPANNERLVFNFLKVSDNMFRTTSYYDDKLILLVKDMNIIEDVPYTDCYVFPVIDNTSSLTTYYLPTPVNGKLFSNFILLDNKYYYIFDSYTSFKNFNSIYYNPLVKPYLKDVLIKNNEGNYQYYKINMNDNQKLYLITDVLNPKNENVEKIVFTYGDKTYFPVAYTNDFNYYALNGNKLETIVFTENTTSNSTDITFHRFDYLEGYQDGYIDRNLAEVPKVTSGKEAYAYASRYNYADDLFIKDSSNNKYIHVNNNDKTYIVDQYGDILLKNADEMLYVPAQYINDWLFNEVVKFDTNKQALVDAYGRTYNEYVLLVKTDPIFYFKEFYNKNVFSSGDDIYTADISLVNRDYKDTYCNNGWHLPSNSDLQNNQNIEALPAQGYKLTASYPLSNGGIYGSGERHYWVSDVAEANQPIVTTYIKDRYDNTDTYNRYYYYSITCKNDLSWSQIQNTTDYINNINKL